jgi:hypothetical protein
LELQQKKSSKAEQVSVSFTNKLPLAKPFSAKYLKKLTGKNDIEDSLKRLGRLTQEEARMASAQLLKITNTIDREVREIADGVLLVDDRVAGVDDRVAGVDERVAAVNERVAAVDDRVKDIDDRIKAVDDKLVVVFDGALYVFNQHRRLSNSLCS